MRRVNGRVILRRLVHLHHLALRTADAARLVAFYRDVLGLRVVRDDAPRATWLAAGDAVVMIERATPGEPTIPAGTLELVAFRIDAAEREPRTTRLAAAGVAIEAETAHTLYFRDPDGRRIGLSSYPFDERAGS